VAHAATDAVYPPTMTLAAVPLSRGYCSDGAAGSLLAPAWSRAK
jgi:hypothetical protein